MKRREFITSVGTLGAASALAPEMVFGRSLQSARYFDLHPFVAAHPEAVFIARTHAVDRVDELAKFGAGQDLARQLFVASDSGGMPLSTKVALKPNLTCLGGDPVEDRLGIVTDPDFVEGFIEGMKTLGLPGSQFYLREGNYIREGGCPTNEAAFWYRPLAEATGAHFLDFDSGRDMTTRGVTLASLQEGSEVIWREVPDGVVYRRIGYLAPINAPDAYNINLAKFKAHSMGMTLASKNWQGTNVTPYVHYCSSVPSQVKDGLPTADLNPNYRADAQALYERHLEAGVPRWDRPGTIDNWNSGAGMETWAQK
ncbi:MAG: DUF362 domain-containing protein, partial [Gemmatimonadota bacterium]